MWSQFIKDIFGFWVLSIANRASTGEVPAVGVDLEPSAAFMRVYGSADPPHGYVRFCEENPKECAPNSNVDMRPAAADILNGTCPSETPSTPAARLDAMAKRLDAMAEAVKTMRPALQGFYASLDDEQKARFNTMSGQSQRQG